jgi:hypothetical protein
MPIYLLDSLPLALLNLGGDGKNPDDEMKGRHIEWLANT